MANSYLTRTPSSAGNKQKFTISAWIKKASVGSAAHTIMCASNGGNRDAIMFDNNKLAIFKYDSGYTYQLRTTRLFRDSSAFYHIVVAFDTTQATASNRVKIYVNGEQVTTLESGWQTYPSQNFNTLFNDAFAQIIGKDWDSSNYFEGNISHLALVDGQQLTPTSFGETDSTSGIWKFKAPSGLSWGTNGVHLKFENSANLGLDSSGQTNNYTVNGNLKQSVDTPSNVYATFNPLSGADTMAVNTTFSNGNNTVVCSGSVYNAFGSTLGVSKGKWYGEFKTNSAPGDGMIGIFAKLGASGNYLGSQTHQYSWYNASGGKFASNSSNLATSVGTYTTNDIIGIALDCDNNKLYYHKNGTYMTYGGGTMNPTSGTYGISITDPDDTDLGFYFMSAMDWGGSTRGNWSANFGNGFFGTTAITSAGSNGNGSLFEYDVPSGFYALTTKNINTYG
jgi:hypothetical protein